MAQEADYMKYFEYYANHTYGVVLAWQDIRDILIDNNLINEVEFNHINNLIIWHDNSKISKEEFEAYALKYFPVEFKDTEFEQEKIENAYKTAWQHHKDNNLHHWQTLKDYKGLDWKCYIVDAVCDWIAMGWATGNLVNDYYEKNKGKIILPIEYRAFLEKVLGLISVSQCKANEQFSSGDQTTLIFK